MLIVKFIVLWSYIYSFKANPINYCRICVNHTMCKYNAPGPGAACKFYDNSILLSTHDVKQLVNTINERRHVVAMGHAKNLPPAANMRKILWSSKLANIAQRWADQCDPFLHPDRKDVCRDLDNTIVGQNVGSIAGGVNDVKSFIEMWYIQVLEYNGSIASYNQAQDYKTNDFTQLIWADTELVGCGRVKFYIDDKEVMIDRLVCNFAPKGNINKSPVYAIGQPASQCGYKMVPDKKFKGLCKHNIKRISTQRPSMRSILRILNVTNTEEKHEIDPIGNNLKLNIDNRYLEQSRNQKMRHVIPTIPYERTAKLITPSQTQYFWNRVMNVSRIDYDYHYPRGHSRLYHGYGPLTTDNYAAINEDYGYQHFRRHDYTNHPSTNTLNYPDSNCRGCNWCQQCTRKHLLQTNNCCTRGYESASLCPSTNICPAKECCRTNNCQQRDIVTTHSECLCTKSAYETVLTNFDNYGDYQHRNIHGFHPITTNIIRLGSGYKSDDKEEMHYYDKVSNIGRKGNFKYIQDKSPKKDSWLFENSGINKPFKLAQGRRHNGRLLTYTGSGRTGIIHPKPYIHDEDYLSFNKNVRKHRQLNNDNFSTKKPFWQMEDTDYNKSHKKQRIKYTTLSKRLASPKLSTNTEAITIKLTAENNNQPVTEKYLSFDELLSLRKLTDKYGDYEFRRKGPTTKKTPPKTQKTTVKLTAEVKKDSTTTKLTTKSSTAQSTTTTTEYTVNTPFERQKHCTRKLTCTWTLFTGENGEGGGKPFIDIGSRTPPGYVEGCTRTSTCTRDFMDRNKISTKPIDESSGEHHDDEDEDYCEKKSLNIRRRHSDNKKTFDFIGWKLDNNSVFTGYDSNQEENLMTTHKPICECNEKNGRQKRNENELNSFLRSNVSGDKEQPSQGMLYNWILNKYTRIMQKKKCHNLQCPCNSASRYLVDSVLSLLCMITTTPLLKDILF